MLPGARYWGLALLGCISLLPILIGPIITGVLVDYGGFDNTQAGITAGFGAVGSVAVALLCALTMHRLPLRRLATAGLCLAAVANFGAMQWIEHHSLFYLCRAFNAIGDGAVYAAVMSAFARETRSERYYGAFMMLQFGLAGLALWALPTYLPDLSARQLYGGFFSLNLLGFSLLPLLPRDAADVAGVSIRGEEWRLLLTLPAMGGLVALMFFEASNIGTDAYMERIAVFAGYSDQQIGQALGLASLLGVPGAFAILFVSSRFGHRPPVLAGITLGSLSLMALMSADNYTSFFVWTCVHSITWAFTTPYIQSILADMDPGGAVVTAGGIASGAGAGVGPSAVAIMVSSTDYRGVLVVSLLFYALAAVAICLAALRRPFLTAPS